MHREASTIRIVRDTVHAPDLARRVEAVADRDRGMVVIAPKPYARTLDWLASDLQKALGKRRHVSGAARNEQERWRLCGVWLLAEEIREVVLLEAATVDTSRWHLLVERCLEAGCDLTLIVGGDELSRGQREFSDSWGCTKLSVEEVLHEWSSHVTDGPAALPRQTFPQVPVADFTVFRARARDLLSKDDFETLDAAFLDGITVADTTFPWERDRDGKWDEAAIAGWLHETLGRIDTVDEALTRIRAAQVACFRRQCLLQLDYRRFAMQARDGAATRLTPELAQRLRWYQQPRLAATGVLAIITGLPPGGLVELNVKDVAADGSSVQTVNGRRDVPEFARALLRAQLVDRASQGARPSDALFGGEANGKERAERMGVRVMQRGYRILSVEIGVRLLGHWTKHESKLDPRWLSRHGVMIKELAT